MTDTDPRLNTVSLYSGAGGLDLGFHEAGFKIMWANDYSEDAVATHNALFGNHHAIAGDIRELKSKLPAASEIDVVIGGPPCQGFSRAGNMDPDDPRSDHVWEFMKIVSEIQPDVFVMENVSTLGIGRRWHHLRTVLVQRSESLGYHTHLRVLNAAHFDVPQARRRMFLIGTRHEGDPFPQPTSEATPPTARSALDSLPAVGEPGNDSVSSSLITPAKNAVMRKSPFAGMLFNGKGRPISLDRPAPTLPASMGGNRTPIIDQYQLENGGPNWIESYHRRLTEGRPSVKRVPSRMRRLTVEEAAALQTFPNGMQWFGSRSSQFRQIGNAVPPVLAAHVASAVLEHLAACNEVTSRDFVSSSAN